MSNAWLKKFVSNRLTRFELRPSPPLWRGEKAKVIEELTSSLNDVSKTSSELLDISNFARKQDTQK